MSQRVDAARPLGEQFWHVNCCTKHSRLSEPYLGAESNSKVPRPAAGRHYKATSGTCRVETGTPNQQPSWPNDTRRKSSSNARLRPLFRRWLGKSRLGDGAQTGAAIRVGAGAAPGGNTCRRHSLYRHRRVRRRSPNSKRRPSRLVCFWLFPLCDCASGACSNGAKGIPEHAGSSAFSSTTLATPSTYS